MDVPACIQQSRRPTTAKRRAFWESQCINFLIAVVRKFAIKAVLGLHKGLLGRAAWAWLHGLTLQYCAPPGCNLRIVAGLVDGLPVLYDHVVTAVEYTQEGCLVASGNKQFKGAHLGLSPSLEMA